MMSALYISRGEAVVVGGSIAVFTVVAALSVRAGRRRNHRGADVRGVRRRGSPS